MSEKSSDKVLNVPEIHLDEKLKKAPNPFLKRLHYTISFCGEHPFATGLFAIIGLISLVLSIYSFSIDRSEAQKTTEQITEESNTLKDKIVENTEAMERIGSKVDQQRRADKSTYQDGTFLYEEKLEGVYSNFWTAYLLRSKPSPELTLRGEGKTIEFSGVITMNCDNGKYLWSTASDFDNPLSDEEIKRIVPEQAIRATYRIFCWDKN